VDSEPDDRDKHVSGLPRSRKWPRLHGPASAYAAIGKSNAAYLAMINDQGGINGRTRTGRATGHCITDLDLGRRRLGPTVV
jgi:hypothetical protein